MKTTTIFVIYIISMLILFIYFWINPICKYRKYDVNNDGKVNSQDYVEIKNYIMEKGE
jgi:hypothetical protein